MPKIEVEHRGLLDEKKFNELNKFLKKNGKSLGEKDRFSVIYYSPGNKDFELEKSNPVDLKVRITNKKSELVLKYGKWGGKDARKEFQFPIDSEKFEEMLEFLQILGFYSGVLQATKTKAYMYKGTEICLVEAPGWGNYFEAEILADSESIEAADKKLTSVCGELGLKVADENEFYELLESMNARPGFKFDFKKEKFLDIKKRFASYF